MLQKGSLITPLNKTSIWSAKVIHTYGGSTVKRSRLGSFFKVVPHSFKLGDLTKRNKLKYKCISTLTVSPTKLNDGSMVRFQFNGGILLRKRLTPMSRELFGPVVSSMRRKKFKSSFSGVI